MDLCNRLWFYRDQLNGANNYPCSEFPGRLPSSFVQIYYYCESGNSLSDNVSGVLTDDPVWDGDGCSNEENCCSAPSLPWFYTVRYHWLPVKISRHDYAVIKHLIMKIFLLGSSKYTYSS